MITFFKVRHWTTCNNLFTIIVQYSTSASDWNPSLVSLKSCQSKMFLFYNSSARDLNTWDYWQHREQGFPSIVISGFSTAGHCLYMILRHPRLRLTSWTRWPSLLSSGWTLPRGGSVTCFTKDWVNVTSSEICFTLTDLPLNSTEHTEILPIGYSNGRLDKPASAQREKCSS